MPRKMKQPPPPPPPPPSQRGKNGKRSAPDAEEGPVVKRSRISRMNSAASSSFNKQTQQQSQPTTTTKRMSRTTRCEKPRERPRPRERIYTLPKDEYLSRNSTGQTTSKDVTKKTNKRKKQQQSQQQTNLSTKQSNTKKIKHTTKSGRFSEDELATLRKNIGMPRKDGVDRDLSLGKDPSRGGSEGYDLPFRELLIDLYQSGQPIPLSNLRSVQRWIKNGTARKRKTGNKASSSMGGIHIFLLAIYKRIYPQASRPQCAVFIATYSEDGRVFTNGEISKGLRKLKMTKKRASTTAYKAFTPTNEYLHYCFWKMNFPAGVNDIRRKYLCDGDEMSVVLGDASLSFGHAVKGCRVRKGGNYGRGRKKITIQMIIEPGSPDIDDSEPGSIERPRIWYRVSRDKGTTVRGYKSFLEKKFLNHLRSDEPRRVMMHDNLSSHKADDIYEAMDAAGHDVICRPPYRPNEAPIEFAFDQLTCEIRRRWERITNEKILIKEIHTIIDTRAGMGGFDKLFRDCGYLNPGENEEESEDNESEEEE